MRHFVVWGVLLALGGCGAARESARFVEQSAERPAQKTENTVAPPGASVPKRDPSARKLVSTARIELVVEDFEKVPSEIEGLARQFSGFIQRTNITGSPGHPRRGDWTIRVPAERFDEFLTAVRRLGEMETVSSEAKDVTEEYSDLEARLRNKKQEETRLLKLLSEATGKLKDVLDVEKELSRVRSEVEQLEGRIRLLSDQTTLATVHLQVSERQDYTPRDAARYRTRLGRALGESLRALANTLQALSILAVALLPWMAVFGLPLVLVWLAVRRYVRRTR